MRKIYIVDMGLLVVAGTVAAVLANEPVYPEKLSHEDSTAKISPCFGSAEADSGAREIGIRAGQEHLDRNCDQDHSHQPFDGD